MNLNYKKVKLINLKKIGKNLTVCTNVLCVRVVQLPVLVIGGMEKAI